MTSHGDVAQWLSRHKLQLVYVVVLKCVIYKKKKKKNQECKFVLSPITVCLFWFVFCGGMWLNQHIQQNNLPK